MLTSSRYTVSRAELELQWSFEDLCVANDTIDMLEEAESRSLAQARAETERNRR